MEIQKENVKRGLTRTNKFGKTEIEFVDDEKVSVLGTVQELVEYSKTHSVAVDRCNETEYMFKSWDDWSKYAVLSGGNVVSYADKVGEICDYGYRDGIHCGVVLI